MAASIVVTGSLDKSCIVWDLNRLEYVRQLQLPGKAGDVPITDIVIDDLSGRAPYEWMTRISLIVL